MREARKVAVTTRLTPETQRPVRLPLDAALEPSPPPAPLPPPGPAARIREALARWLEEEM